MAVPAAADPPLAAAGSTLHGFLAAGGVLTPIDHPYAAGIPSVPGGLTGTDTLGINDRGQIVGMYEGRDRLIRHFVLGRKGRYTIIADPSGPSGDRLSYETLDINNRGEIVGFYHDDQGFTTSGFLRTRRGRFVDIRVPDSLATAPVRLSDRRQVVGLYVDGGGVHGFLWDEGDFQTIDVGGASATAVWGINNRGQMVGTYIDVEGAYNGFLRDRRGSVVALPEAYGADPAMGGTYPHAINERGQIVGGVYDSRGGSRGFLLERGRFEPIHGPDATYTRALDINNRGQIVGDYGTAPPTGSHAPDAGNPAE